MFDSMIVSKRTRLLLLHLWCYAHEVLFVYFFDYTTLGIDINKMTWTVFLTAISRTWCYQTQPVFVVYQWTFHIFYTIGFFYIFLYWCRWGVIGKFCAESRITESFIFWFFCLFLWYRLWVLEVAIGNYWSFFTPLGFQFLLLGLTFFRTREVGRHRNL